MSTRHTAAVVLAVAFGTIAIAQQPETFGKGVSLEQSTPLTRILERPADFEGKTVRVEGTVKAVCQHMGCWMAFSPDGETTDRTLLVKVDDGVIVFPITAKGRKAAAQGVIQRVAGAEAKEAAAEHARAAGSASATAPTSWHLKATGAIVYPDPATKP
jgi:hypothetical protein